MLVHSQSSGLTLLAGIAVDKNGMLYVADETCRGSAVDLVE
jgi:hypothetical protein